MGQRLAPRSEAWRTQSKTSTRTPTGLRTTSPWASRTGCRRRSCPTATQPPFPLDCTVGSSPWTSAGAHRGCVAGCPPGGPPPGFPECHSTLNKDAWDTPRGILLIPGTNPPMNNFDLAAQLATRATTDLYSAGSRPRRHNAGECVAGNLFQADRHHPAGDERTTMLVPLGIWRVRGVATVLASGTAISLIALSAGVGPALAEPLTETTLPTETEYVPTEEVITEVPTADEVPPQIQTTVAPQLPLEPTPQAPVVTQETQAPIVTQETQAPIVTQTTQAPVVTQEPQIVTTTAAPEVTAEPVPETTTGAAPIPTPTAPVSTTAPTPISTPPALVTTTEPTLSSSAAVTTTTPVTTESTTGTSTSPSPSAAVVPSTTTPSSGTSQTTAEGSTSTPPTTQDSTSGSAGTSEPDTTAGGGSPEPSSNEQTGSAEQPAGVTPLAEPQRLEAAPQDIKLAQQATPVEENPPPAPQTEIDRLRSLVIPPTDAGANGATSVSPMPGLPRTNAGSCNGSRIGCSTTSTTGR